MQKQKGECISKTTQLFAELCWDLSWKRRAWDLPRTALHPMHAALQHQHKHKQLEEGRNTWVHHCWQGKRLCSHRHLVWIDLQAELGRPKGKMQCRNSKQRGGLPQPSYECLFQRTAAFYKADWKLVSSSFWENSSTLSFYWQSYCCFFTFFPAPQSHLSAEEVNQSLFWHKAERTQLDLRSQGGFSVLAVKKVKVLFVN